MLLCALLPVAVQAGEKMVPHGVKEKVSRKFVEGSPSPEVLRSLVRKMNKRFSKRGISLKGGYGFTMETAWVLPDGRDEDDVLDCIPGYECYETIESHTGPDGRRYIIRPGLIDYKDTTYSVNIWFDVTKNQDYRKSKFFRRGGPGGAFYGAACDGWGGGAGRGRTGMMPPTWWRRRPV